MAMKKIIAAALAVTLLGSTLAGCSSGDKNTGGTDKSGVKTEAGSENQGSENKTAGSDEREKLEFWGWWGSEARKPVLEEAVKMFNESQDKYEVTYVNLPWGDVFTKNIAQIAAGNPTDIMANTLEEVRFRAEQGQVESLDDFLKKDEGTGVDSFIEQDLNACTGEDGSVYALPFSVDTRVIYYNKDHFMEAGLDPENPPKTWDELKEAAYKLEKKNGDTYERIGFLPLLGNGGLDSWVCNANKGQIWYDDSEVPAVDTDINKDVFRWVDEFTQHYGRNTYNEMSAAFKSGMQDPFSSGKLSMLLQTSAYVSSLKQTNPDLNYGVMLMPEYKEGNGHTVNGSGFVLEIPKGAKNPEGSYEFIKFMTSKDMQEFLCERLGDFSARTDFDKDGAFLSDPITAKISEALSDTKAAITPNNMKGYTDIINPLIEEGTLGVKSTDDALANAQKAFQDFLK